MITYTIKKTTGVQEWVVRYHQDGKFMPEWTYYANDKEDAEATAKYEVARMKSLQSEGAAL